MAKTPQTAPEGARRPTDEPPPPPPPPKREISEDRPPPLNQKADVRDLQAWHIEVALFHLKQVNPDVMHNDLLGAWGKLTNNVVLMTAALEALREKMPECPFCHKTENVSRASKGGFWCNEYGCGAFAFINED